MRETAMAATWTRALCFFLLQDIFRMPREDVYVTTGLISAGFPIGPRRNGTAARRYQYRLSSRFVPVHPTALQNL